MSRGEFMNESIRLKIRKAGLYQYQVAMAIGISEQTFIRWLRFDLDEPRKMQIDAAIQTLSKEMSVCE